MGGGFGKDVWDKEVRERGREKGRDVEDFVRALGGGAAPREAAGEGHVALW